MPQPMIEEIANIIMEAKREFPCMGIDGIATAGKTVIQGFGSQTKEAGNMFKLHKGTAFQRKKSQTASKG